MDGAALLRRAWGGVGGEDGEREAAGVRIGSGRRGTSARERDEGELAREREDLAKGGNLLMAHPGAVRH